MGLLKATLFHKHLTIDSPSAKISQYGHDGSLSNKCVSAETA